MPKKNRTPRHYNADDCKCCICCCMPAIILSCVFENLFKSVCCCPCYTDICYKKIINPITTSEIPLEDEDEIEIEIPVAMPINDDLKDRYFGKIWGWGKN